METATPGFTMQPIPVIRPLYPQELFFEDVRVPVENRIGEEGQGFAVVEDWLVHGRVPVCGGDDRGRDARR